MSDTLDFFFTKMLQKRRLMPYLWQRARSRTLVLEVPYGGLGDHLFYSHLPRLAKASGRYAKVLLSTKSLFRYPDIQSLIWEKNPYLDGVTDAPGAHSAVRPLEYYVEFERVRPGHNLMDEFMLFYGIDDGARFHEPELYYTPVPRPEFADKVIFDPCYQTNAADTLSRKDVEAFFLKAGVKVDYQFRFACNSVSLPGVDSWLTPSSLAEFADIIHSCKAYYSFASGGATLAAALKKPATVLYDGTLAPDNRKRMYLHSKINTYVAIT